MEEPAIGWAGAIVVILVALAVFLGLYNMLTGGTLFRGIVCSMLFWVPLGALTTTLTQSCAAIPV
ncbi:MAG TPA: hypothetical protein VJH90_02670 [archaeon]|nr:hypothetical protein [archaeon]